MQQVMLCEYHQFNQFCAVLCVYRLCLVKVLYIQVLSIVVVLSAGYHLHQRRNFRTVSLLVLSYLELKVEEPRDVPSAQ